MKATYNWLKDFVEIKIPPKVLADKLTMAGLEVTALEEKEGDFIFEIEVTSNRPDWLSVIGVAREVAAITGKPLKKVSSIKYQVSSKGVTRKAQSAEQLAIRIQDKNDCPQYTATVIEGVKVAPSPEWMQKRLRAVGLRPVNNVVDITNYILYETGQPLHAFDLDKVRGQKTDDRKQRTEIFVRRAKKNETIVTIDGFKRALDEDILVIADADKPIAVAGIIGGRDTEVGENTKNILLESAEFEPIIVRRGARLLAVSTDSSYRFERKVDPGGVTIAAQRAAALITKLCGGEVNCKCQVSGIRYQEKKITLSIEKAQGILGVKIPPAKIKQILRALGFKLARPMLLHGYPGLQHVAVYVPSFRQDVNIEEDLAEEAARIYGYNNIPLTLPYVLPRLIDPLKLKHLSGQNIDARLIRKIRNILPASGFNEVINYSLTPYDALKKNMAEGLIQKVEIRNPLSKEQEILRPDLFFGLLSNIAYNFNRNANSIKIFEIGKIFKQTEAGLSEILALGLAAAGRYRFDWQRMDKSRLTLFDLKGCLKQLLLKIGMGEARFILNHAAPLSWGTVFDIYIKDKRIGIIGEVSPEALSNYSIKEREIFLAQISLKDLAKGAKLEKTFKPYSVYPSTKRDISFLLKKDINFEEAVRIIYSAGKEIVADVELLEQYTGKQVPEGFKSLLLSIEYSSFERTLKDEEVDGLHGQIINKLTQELAVKIR